MAAKHVGLGRGLGALIQDASPATAPAATPGSEKPRQIPVGRIRKSPWQPRHTFEQDALADLVASVKEHGVLQPLLVRAVGDTYELIAGERRFRAAQEAGLSEVPVIEMNVTDREALELALIENLQRSDLNLMEEAEGYRMLAQKFDMTQEQIAERVGKARPTIANALRLLDLPTPVKQLVAERKLTPGHAKALLGLNLPREMELLADRVVAEDISVRSLERIVARTRKGPAKPKSATSDLPSQHLDDLVDRLHQHFGTSVRLTPCKTLSNGKKLKGRLEIDFHSSEELDHILHVAGLTESF
ncbi:MAG TPA: ParB/RepB/Spo0J family partition protein [Kiritimatiellia bacterium]|nr:ParB/RepB/Spo0J family partition protein [Kiritimatiellia bacterium]